MALRTTSSDHLQDVQIFESFRELTVQIVEGASNLFAVNDKAFTPSPILMSDLRRETWAQCVEFSSRQVPDLCQILRDDFAKLKILKTEFQRTLVEMNACTLLLKESNDRSQEALEKEDMKEKFMEEILQGAQSELENVEFEDDTTELQGTFDRLKLFLDELLEEHYGEYKQEMKEIAAAVYKRRNESDKYWKIPEHLHTESVLILLVANIIEVHDEDFTLVKQAEM